MSCVTISSSHNLVSDLSDILYKGKSPKVFFALFENNNDILVLREALKVVKLSPEGILIDANLLKCMASDRTSINKWKKFARSISVKYPLVNVEKIRQLSERGDTVVIVAKAKTKVDSQLSFAHLKSFFEKARLNCSLYLLTDIQNSAIVNGTLRVINRIGYLNEWPWFADIINKNMPSETRQGFGFGSVVSRVVSNGEFYHYSDFSSPYSEFRDGFRKVSGYRSITDKEKWRVILLGDSRFVNGYAPTELTIASYLQNNLINNKIHCEILNISVAANRVQNQFAMLKSFKLAADKNIVICTVCPVGLYYDFKHDFNGLASIKKFRIKVRMMRDMTEYCSERGIELLFVHLPMLKDIPNLTKLEQYIADSYGLSYSPDRNHDLMKQLAMSHGVKVIDLSENIINTERTCFFVDYSHFSPEGSECIAGVLAGYVRSIIERESALDDEEVTALAGSGYEAHRHYVVESQYKGMWEYLQGLHTLSEGKPENCGAIVMNCNPFTLGHRYLIDTARAQVDYLYILIVEEDRSIFKFKDRIEMVRRSVADIPDVEVIPSGRFVISALTFPEYFEKGDLQDETIDTTKDIEIFCTKIAPALHISTRFVGEEPLDRVTNQYNMRMKELLPEYGIKLVEIKRKEAGDTVISASRVRKLLEEKQYNEVKMLVPPPTYDYLINVLGF